MICSGLIHLSCRKMRIFKDTRLVMKQCVLNKRGERVYIWGGGSSVLSLFSGKERSTDSSRAIIFKLQAEVFQGRFVPAMSFQAYVEKCLSFENDSQAEVSGIIQGFLHRLTRIPFSPDSPSDPAPPGVPCMCVWITNKESNKRINLFNKKAVPLRWTAECMK